MPDKHGQLLPGEEEQGLEEGDLSDYLMPFKSGLKKIGRGIIGKLIKKGAPTKPNKPPPPASAAEQEKLNDTYRKSQPMKLTSMSKKD